MTGFELTLLTLSEVSTIFDNQTPAGFRQYPRGNKLTKILRPTSKFYEPEGLYESNSIPRVQKYQAPPNKMQWPQQRGTQVLCTAALTIDDKISRNGTTVTVKVTLTDTRRLRINLAVLYKKLRLVAFEAKQKMLLIGVGLPSAKRIVTNVSLQRNAQETFWAWSYLFGWLVS